jgi:hypothetical protein
MWGRWYGLGALTVVAIVLADRVAWLRGLGWYDLP